MSADFLMYAALYAIPVAWLVFALCDTFKALARAWRRWQREREVSANAMRIHAALWSADEMERRKAWHAYVTSGKL